jgi:glycerophosphoryl diester phosphodiesterase
MSSKMLVFGHRGVGDVHLENTMTGFQMAIDAGADGLETDIHMTRDGHLILIHDNKVDRTTDGSGFVCEKTLSDIRGLTIGQSEKIPLLLDLFELTKKYPDLLLNLEIKAYPDIEGEVWTSEVIDKTIRMLEEYDLVERSVLTSFSSWVLTYIDEKYDVKYKLQGFYPYFVMREKKAADAKLYSACMYYIMQDEHGRRLDTGSHVCPKEWFDYLLANDIEPWLSTGVKSKEELALALERGGRLVTSDEPEVTLSHLRSIGAHV